MKYRLLSGFFLSLLALVLWFNPPAQADTACYLDDFYENPLTVHLAHIIGAVNQPVFFQIPLLNPQVLAHQKPSPYVIPHDEVLISKENYGWGCALYIAKTGQQTAGWLPTKHLAKHVNLATLPLEAWVGTWKQFDSSSSSTIQISKKQNSLIVDGNAEHYNLASKKESIRLGAVNVGEMGGEAKPHGNHLALLADQEVVCEVHLTLLSPSYLWAKDNGQCGGVNVTFSGFYRNTK